MFGVVFSDRILAFAESSARAFSLIAAARRKRGRPMSELDGQITGHNASI
jgi:predicted nucleic acid-binding protein